MAFRHSLSVLKFFAKPSVRPQSLSITCSLTFPRFGNFFHSAAFNELTSSTKNSFRSIGLLKSGSLPFYYQQPQKTYHAVAKFCPNLCSPLLQDLRINPGITDAKRTVTKFSFKGTRKTVRAVVDRFYRLNWGAWIRPKAGRHKRLWQKSTNRRRRLRQHVFCNATQSRLLDKMVTNFWRKPKYYVDDPYESYHKRNAFGITRKL